MRTKVSEVNEVEVRIPSGEIELAGIWTTPAGAGVFPAALLLGGSGPLDRDGNVKRMPLSVSRDLARLLGEMGWGSLRFDKRGVGGSGGDYLATGLYEELGDAEAAYAWMASQDGVTAKMAIGHSVGASMASELATTHDDLAGIVMLAATAKTGEETLAWQTLQMKENLLPKPVEGLLRLFGTDVVKQQAKAVAKLKETKTDVARIQLAKVNAKWMREFIAYDPRPTLDRVSVDVLAITGSKDVQVDPADLDVIADRVARVETHLVEDVDHILRHEPEAVSSPKNYRSQLQKPIDPRVVESITEWITRRETS